MKNFIILLVFFFVGCNEIFGQVPNSDVIIATQTDTQKTPNSNQLFFLVKESFPLEVKDKLYLKNEFMEGTIYDFENKPHEVSIRYRFYDDEMQIQHFGKTKALFPQRVNKIILKNNNTDQVFIPTSYFEKKIKQFGYFELLTDGKMSLLIGYRSAGKSDYNKVYFYKKEAKPAQCFKTKKSKFLKIFGDKKSEVAKYIVSEKLNLKNEEHLKQIFDYFNSL